MSLQELIEACAGSGDPEVWEEFVRRFHGLIAGVVLRTAQRWGQSSRAEIDDLIQETYLKVCADRQRLLTEFRPQHPEAFYGYIKVIAANVVHDHFRARHSHKRGMGKPETSLDAPQAPVPAAGTSSAARMERQVLMDQVDHALSAHLAGHDGKRDRIIFWLYYRYGFTAAAISRMPSISLTVKGVESVIYRLTRLVREELVEESRTSV